MNQTDFSVLAKPVGSACNLNCSYCYYSDPAMQSSAGNNTCMQEDILDRFIRQYVRSQDTAVVRFIWHGGEPMLAGLSFYENAIEIQRKYSQNKTIQNTIQINGTLIDEEWARFFRKHQFLVGVSVDGPEHLHDFYRKSGQTCRGSFKRTLRGVEFLKKYDVQFNTLTAVTDSNSAYPLEVYNFLKETGSRFMQFIPVVEQVPLSNGVNEIAPWSVRPEKFGEFLTTIFDEWVRHDVGKVFVHMFDNTLSRWLGYEGGLCVFNKFCGDALVVEKNGDVYSCDHFISRVHLLGNIIQTPLDELFSGRQNIRFGRHKQQSLSEVCLKCRYLTLCFGGCPKYRFCKATEGDPGLQYLCEAYKRFFYHVTVPMNVMAKLISKKQPPAKIMALFHS
jgi:uncharacterized protein